MFYRIVFSIQDLLWAHINVRIVFPTALKNAIGILIGVTLNLCMALGASHRESLYVSYNPLDEQDWKGGRQGEAIVKVRINRINPLVSAAVGLL